MIIGRDFFAALREKIENKTSSDYKRDNENRVHVAMYSKDFSSQESLPVWTNAMYEGFRKEINDSLETVGFREQVTLDLLESGSSTEEEKEMILIGFRKYMDRAGKIEKKRLILQVFTFTIFLIVGVSLVFLRFQVLPENWPRWVYFCIEMIASVFSWQYVGYMAFEFPTERRKYLRTLQIRNLKVSFRHWE